MTEHALKRFQFSLLTGLLAGGLVMGAPVSLAQDEERKTKQTVAMSQQVYEALVEIQTMVEETKDYAGAEAAAREMLQNDKLSPYETAQIWNLTAYSYYLQERYADAINAFETARPTWLPTLTG